MRIFPSQNFHVKANLALLSVLRFFSDSLIDTDEANIDNEIEENNARDEYELLP